MTTKLFILPISAALILSACKSNQSNDLPNDEIVKQDTKKEK